MPTFSRCVVCLRDVTPDPCRPPVRIGLNKYIHITLKKRGKTTFKRISRTPKDARLPFSDETSDGF